MLIFYTHKERTEKKYTIYDIKNAALSIALDRSKETITALNTKSILHYTPDDLFTLVELNDIVRILLRDTFFFKRILNDSFTYK